MTDNVAALGLQVDSSQVTSATKALQGLQQATAPAVAAVSALTAAAQPAATATAALATATAAVAPATAAIASAAAPAAAATANLANATHAAAAAHGGLSTQAMSAFHAMRSMFEGIASGMPATTVLTQQLNHLGYAASGPGGLVGAFGEVLGILGGFITPTTVLIGSLGALGAAAVAAMTAWDNSQRAVQIGLLGIGQASGVTLGDINRIATTSSSLMTISQSEARTVATTLASTGKIGGDAIQLLTSNAKQLSIALGTNVDKAAEVMAKAFSDPAKGAAELADRLGGVDAATLRLVQNLQAQGDRQAAINVLAQAVLPNIQHATDLTSGWARAWNVVSNEASKAFDAVGKALSGPNLMSQDEGSLQAQRKSLEAQITMLQTANIPNSNVTGHVNQLFGQLGAINEALMRVQDNAKKATEEAEKLQSLQLRGTFDQFLPEVNQQQTLTNNATAIGNATQNSSLIAKMGLTPDQAARAKDIVDDLKAHYKTAFQEMQTSSSIAMQAVTAFSPAARATISELQTIEQLRSRTDLSPEEKATAAQNAYNLSLKQTTTSLSEVAREQLLSAQLATDSARVQLQTIGASVGETYRLTAVEQARAQLVQEAAKNRTPLDQAQLNALTKQIDLTAQLKQKESERTLQSNTSFNTSQLGRTDLEGQVASQLRSVYSDKYTEQLNGAIADQIRFNSLLTDTKSTAQGALSGFVNDLVQGKTAAQALQTAMQGVERKLIDMASNAIISNLFKSLLGNAGGGTGGGLLSFLTPAATHHTGGIVGSDAGPMRTVSSSMFASAPRFHDGGLVPGDVPAVLQSGEGVFTAAQMRALAPAGQGGGGGGNNVQVNVHNNANGTTIEHRKSSNGNVDIHDIIIKAVGDKMASGGFDAPMRARFGQQVKPRGR